VARVRLVGIRKALDRNPILKGIDLDIADGELVVLVGPSGCGKSTLLRTLAGLEAQDGGEVWIGERRVDALEPRDRNVAMVFQSYALYPHMDVRSNLGFALRLRGVGEGEVARRVREVAAMLGIEALLDRFPRQLSGGQRQRVAMGRALVREADVYLLDEPLSNLDAALRTQTRVEIKGLHGRLRATMVYVTHDQVEAMTLADRLVVLRAGEVMQVGAPSELYERPANTFVATFLGTPPMNLLRASVRDGRLVTDGLDLPCPREAAGKREVVVGLRPHDLVSPEEHVGPGAARGSLLLTVEAVEPLGWDANVHCRDGEQRVVVRFDAKGARGLREGGTLALAVPLAAAHLFDPDTEVAIGHGCAPPG
jgi:ABC-type sugar transport system ATPase subunit